MMASIIPPSFSPHGGMPHPPPHPMAPGMAHNPSQPGVAPGNIPHQLVGHMGVSGPGPQMNPAALMGGMPPGVGNPNAHAMQHLNPAQAQIFQQQHMRNQQQQFQQHQRLQALQQQQQNRQAMIAQQTAMQNMAGMPMGIPMNQQHYAAQMGRMPPGVLPPHLQQQARLQQQHAGMNPAIMAQQLAIQQQHMNQMNQQANNPNQPQMNPQFNLQQAQLAALNHNQQVAAQQQAAQAQAHQAQGQAQQSQQAQQQQQQAQQQPGQQQQQTPQQQQQGQGGPGANGPAQNQVPTQNPTPQPNPQQQPQAPPQTPQTTQAQQAQAAQLHAQHQAVQQAAVANLMPQKREIVNLKGVCLLKLMQFNEHLSGYPGSKAKDDLDYWNRFVGQFFSQKGVFRHSILVKDKDQETDKMYEIAYPALARYFHTHFDSGVKTMHISLDKGTSDRPLPGDCHWIECKESRLVYWFEENSHVVAHGILRAQFDHEQKFELFEFQTTGHEEYISRDLVIQAARPSHNWVKEWKTLNQQDNKQSPEMSKKGKAKAMKSPPNAPPDIDLPASYIKTNMGITEAVYQFLEMVEIMGQMNPLFGYYHAHPGLAPYSALDQYVQSINAAQGVNGPAMAQGAPRTPGFGQFPMGASPAMANQVLPGSPHIGSPAPNQMQAPIMQLQASQQGTNSSGPSANTSPSQNNKRRRASAVKEEDTPASAPTPSAAGTPQMNGVAVKGKQPPTPRMQKRLKGNPS